jgi:hypothetical protein
LPNRFPSQASSDYVRAHVGYFIIPGGQECLAYGWLQPIHIQHESWVSSSSNLTPVLSLLLTFSFSGAAAHGDYVFGWKGDTLQKAMDNSCNGNTDCAKAGITAQKAAQYNACTVSQQAPEAVDGCKSHSLPLRYIANSYRARCYANGGANNQSLNHPKILLH